MDDKSAIIQRYPIGNSLDSIRLFFRSICDAQKIPYELDLVVNNDLEKLANALIIDLQSHFASNELIAHSGQTLRFELQGLRTVILTDASYTERLRPLLNAVLNNQSDVVIWDEVYRVITVSTPPPGTILPSVQDTPSNFTTNSISNSNEFRKDIDNLLKEELGSIYIGLPDFYDAFFGKVEHLKDAASFVFRKCTEGDNALYDEKSGWRQWPEIPMESLVVKWFHKIVKEFKSVLDSERDTFSQLTRELLSFPNKPLKGSKAKRKLDIGIGLYGLEGANRWSQILIPGELKENSAMDSNKSTWLDLGRYAREVFAAQNTRRFVMGFTLCGSMMRLWEFDRLGGIASESFDINQDGLRFVSSILGYLMMSEEQLGFDPTIQNLDGKLYIDIQRGETPERLVIDKPIISPRCIVGRATTCWKAHKEQDDQTTLVIKDSWQFPEQEEEGKLLSEVPENANVAQYYHHETVRIHNKDDDIQNNVRCMLDISKATNYKANIPKPSKNPSKANSRCTSHSSNSTGRKRQHSPSDIVLPPSKRSNSIGSSKSETNTLHNRIHRRVIIRNYGYPIYKASSLISLLEGVKQCIQGHQSLYKVQILHRDISINNLLITEDNNQVHGFLIDLDLAIKITREESSGAQSKTGTKVFMAIGVLQGEPHSFMHDLESFFWVLFWLCIHYDEPTKRIAKVSEENVGEFEAWNFLDIKSLATYKLGTVADESSFIRTASENFTPYYQPLIPCVNKLRKEVFPNDKSWKKEDESLYTRMIEILQDAQRQLREIHTYCPEVLTQK